MNRTDEIVKVFEANGGMMTTLRLAHACIEADLYTEVELANASVRWVMSECRKALKKTDKYGLPYAGPTPGTVDDEAGPLWKQLALWSYADFEYNICDRASGLVSDYEILIRLRDACNERYGMAPPVPDLVR